MITAAKKYGARGVGIDIDPERVAEANDNVKKAGVATGCSIMRGDLFETTSAPATVVTLYLLTDSTSSCAPSC